MTRQQCVSLKGLKSDYLIVEKGVPQGSSLGPLLFSIFINGLPKICSDCQVHLYAGDTEIYTSKADRFEIERSLQREFAFIQNSFSCNKLLLKKNRSCSMLFSTRLGLGYILDLTIYFNDGSPLEQVTSKHLGLWIDPILSFKQHIESIIKKLNCNLGILYRSINCFTLQMRKIIGTQLLLPTVYWTIPILFIKTPLKHIFNLLTLFIIV